MAIIVTEFDGQNIELNLDIGIISTILVEEEIDISR